MIKNLIIGVLVLTNLWAVAIARIGGSIVRDIENELYNAQGECEKQKKEMSLNMSLQKRELEAEIERLQEKLENRESQKFQLKGRPTAKMMRN
jgi:hypothetical protein